MDFGLFVNPQAPRDHTAESLFEGMVDLARAGEAAGFDHVSAGQHFLSDFTQVQLVPYLSRLTGEVSGMDVSTGAVVLPLLHPIQVAEDVATIDAMHDGRTYLGVAAGYRDAEFDNFGVPKSERGGRMKEGVELLGKLLSEESVTYDGEFYAVEDASLPFRPDDEIPIWMAANANVAVRRAAAVADGWLVPPHSTVAEVREQKDAHYDPVREERGVDTGTPVIREAFVAETREEAVDVGREYLAEKYERYVSWGQHEAMEDESELQLPFDDLAEDRFVLGTPAEVCEEVERYEDELDASHLLLRVHWPGLDYERSRECVELIGDEVIPNV